MAQLNQIQVRRDTAANWATVNPTLAAGEIGFETDTGRLKVGNGSTAWNSLTFVTDASKISGNQTANTVFAGPATGIATTPTFRALVANDIPTLSTSKISGLATSATTDTTNASNITSGTLDIARFPNYATAPTLWYSPTSAINMNGGNAFTAVSGNSNFYDIFNLTNGVTVANNTTYFVEYVIVGTTIHSTATSSAPRLLITGDAVANFQIHTLTGNNITGGTSVSPNVNYQTAKDTNTNLMSTVASGTSMPFSSRITGILRTGSTGSYFQVKLGLSVVSTTSYIQISRESFASLRTIGASGTTSQGTWS